MIDRDGTSHQQGYGLGIVSESQLALLCIRASKDETVASDLSCPNRLPLLSEPPILAFIKDLVELSLEDT